MDAHQPSAAEGTELQPVVEATGDGDADASLRTWVRRDAAPPEHFPYPEVGVGQA